MEQLKKSIKEKALNIFEDLVRIRRHLHMYPELSFSENNTSEYIAQELKNIGISPKRGVADTGMVAEIKGNNPEKGLFALRADMDALPIKELNDKPYASKNEGVMHACGHDAHTTSLLGAARILNDLKDQWEGTVRLIFQPGEEKMPGGASKMIKEGVLKNPEPSGIIGQHVMPQLEAGKVGFRSGMYMASCDEIYMTVKGKGGHGAMPEYNIDPVLISSHIIVALQQIISRNASPKLPTVLSFGKIIGNGATNIIPDEVYIEGTFRALNEEWRSKAHQLIYKMTNSIAEGMGGSCHIDIVKGYPYLENNPKLTENSRSGAEEYLGKENVVDLDIWMGGEDFSYYTHEIPGCFYRFGVRNEEKNIASPVHTPTFDIDEDALKVSSGLMAWLALWNLNKISQ